METLIIFRLIRLIIKCYTFAKIADKTMVISGFRTLQSWDEHRTQKSEIGRALV